MTEISSTSRTSRELLKALRTPVARFYPCDLHVHSLGSYDVCQAGHFQQLSPGLQQKVTDAMRGTTFQVPLSREPSDPAQFDEKICTPELVQAFLDELGVRRDAVAQSEAMLESDNWSLIGITDHNTSTFACALSQLAWQSRTTNRVVVLPGIELDVAFSVAGIPEKCQVHILCLFAPCTKVSDIRIAINDSKPSGVPAWTMGKPIEVTDLAEFVNKLRSHASYPAMCIAAHVWSKKGVQNEPTKLILAHLDAQIVRLEGELARAKAEGATVDEAEISARLAAVQSQKQDGETIHLDVLRIIGTCGFDALQVRDQTHETHYRRLHRFRDEHGRSVPIVSSDSHSPSTVFSCASGIPFAKISTAVLASGSPTDVFEELRARVLRFGETRMTYTSPGAVTYWIEGIEISRDAVEAKDFWGNTAPDAPAGEPFTLALSRNLNCFVGGRGSGKSAGVEAIAFLTDPGPFTAQGTAREQEDWYQRARATLSGCRIRLVWKATGNDGIGALPKKALVVSRYFDLQGRHQPIDIRDADDNAIVDDRVKPPRIRILRVHEIEVTARAENLRKLFDDLCGSTIEELNLRIESVRGQLVEQRKKIVGVIELLSQLTADGSPLRQYGLRKRQYETVNKPELQTRFEEVDKAAAASNTAVAMYSSWQTLRVAESIGEIETQALEFFTNAVSMIPQTKEKTVPTEYEKLSEIVAESQDPKSPGKREAVLTTLQSAKESAASFELGLFAAKEANEAAHQARTDQLAKEGLPTGSSEREAKKRSYEQAVADHSLYVARMNELELLLTSRQTLQTQLVDACKERTSLRTTRADEITAQLARDLDAKVLRIVVVAKPMADRQQFDRWLQTNVEPTFSRYKNPRRAAILESGIMPTQLRELLLHDGDPDLSALKNSRDRAEDGRVDESDAVKILSKCRGRRRVSLDENDTWDEAFSNTLPADIRDGVVVFPVVEGSGDTCIDRVFQLDELVLEDAAEVRLNDRPEDPLSEPRPLDQLSPGQRCSAILPILLLSGDYPLVIDQPEENLDNRLIRQVIVNILASMKLRRQVIIATHNPNLPVLGDVEQCVVLQAKGRDLSAVVATGNLDSADVARYITDIMEGGREAFQYRQSIYQYHWSGPVDTGQK